MRINVLQIILVFFILGFSAFLVISQVREYYVYGNVTDTNNLPLVDVEIQLRDMNTSRSYHFKTDTNGRYKYVGLPHGIYQVTIAKEGYESRTDEWRFETPQDRMQKVEIKTMVMISQARLKEIKLNQKVEGEIKEATLKIQNNEFDAAIEVLNKTLQTRPEDENALYLKGICLLKKNMYTESVDVFKKVTDIKPEFVNGHIQLGVSYQKLKDFDNAIKSYLKVMELDSNNFISSYNLGLIFYEKGKPVEAQPYFEKAAAINPDLGDVWEMLGICYIHMEKYEKAQECLLKAKEKVTDEEKRKSLDDLIKNLQEQIKK